MASSIHATVQSQPVLFAKVWQQPYVNVFKQVGVFEGRHVKVQGDVRTVVDPTINKQVLCLRGSVSAANYVELPGPGASAREREKNPSAARVQSLGLTGEYVYMQIRSMADRYFTIHIDVATTQGLTVRLSISNIYKYIKLMNHGRVLQLPCDFLSTRWSVLAMHLPSLLDECSRNVSSMNPSDGNGDGPIPSKYTYSSIQRMQFCSNLFVKNVLTTPHHYSIHSFPKEVRFYVGPGYSFDDFYDFFWIVTPPDRERMEKKEQERLQAQQQRQKEHEEEEKVQQEEQASAAATAAARPTTAKRGAKVPTAARGKRTGQSSEAKVQRPQSALALASASSQQQRLRQSRSEPNRSAHVVTTPGSRPTSVPVAVSSNVIATLSHSPAASPMKRDQRRPTSSGGDEDAGASKQQQQQKIVAGSPSKTLSSIDFKEHPSSDQGQGAMHEHELEEEPRSASQLPVSTQQQRPSTADSSSTRTATRPSTSTQPAPTSPSDSPLGFEPVLELDRVVGYTPSLSTRNLTWSPCGRFFLYPVNNLLVLNDSKTGAQEFLAGHTEDIKVVTISSNGIVATAQQGKQALIRLWNLETRQCIAVLLAHHSDMKCLTFSYLNLMLGAVGRDAQGRQLIVIWDISALLDTGSVHIVARQLSDANISRILFSPFREDPLNLVSCGHESIRFWRIKSKHLPGQSLQLNEYARNTFTDLAFESKYGEADHTSKRLFVSTASGALFQINYQTRTLETIYKLHSGPIYSISVNEGFCVTGSGDQFLRVWPLDFSDFYLQAQHKCAISCVQLSGDGLSVLVGNEAGSIGMLDLTSTAYQTRVRSHLDTVYGVAFDPNRDEFATVSKDGTIRIFGLHTLEQIYEFYSPGEVVHCVAYHPSAAEYRLACGFASGSMRVMDIASTSMQVDYQQHRGRVLDVLFSPDGAFLYSSGEDGAICAYDVSKDYLPVRMFTTYRNQPLPPLPPSVARNIAAEMERVERSKQMSARSKAEHDERTPYISHHLDRAREEAEQWAKPPQPLPHHSMSHARHCLVGGGAGAATGTGAGVGVGGVGMESGEVATSVAASVGMCGNQAVPSAGGIPLHALAINGDGSLLATIGADPCTIVLLSTETLRQVRLFSTLSSAPVSKLLFAALSTELVAVLTDGSFQRFHVLDGALIAHVKLQPTMQFRQERSGPGIKFGGGSGGQSLAPPPPPSSSVVTSASISPIQPFLVTGTNDPLIRLWHYGSKPHAPHFQSYTAHQSSASSMVGSGGEGVSSVTFSPDGCTMISTGGCGAWIWKVRGAEDVSFVARAARMSASASAGSASNSRGVRHVPVLGPEHEDEEKHDRSRSQRSELKEQMSPPRSGSPSRIGSPTQTH